MIRTAGEERRVLRQTMTDESDARHSNETKQRRRNTRHEEGSVHAVTYAFRLVKSHNDERYLIANYAACATTVDFVVSSFDYVTPDL